MGPPPALIVIMMVVLVLFVGPSFAQTQPRYDHDSPLGNRKGLGKEDDTYDKYVGSRTLEARRVKRNSKGRPIVDQSISNNTVTLEMDEEVIGMDGNRRRLQTVYPSILDTIDYSNELDIFYDPPNNTFSESALGVFVRANKPDAKIYYEFEDVLTQFVSDPTLDSAYTTWDSPYIHLNTPFGATRNRSINLCIVWFDSSIQSLVRSPMVALRYTVEANDRPQSFGFLVPGVETDGYFVKFVLEMKAAARAQVAGGQEFADFYTDLGVGTYQNQVIPMRLLDLHSDLGGFEGGFSVNCTDRLHHYGILVPYHNGNKFVGQVVRVNLQKFTNGNECMQNYRREYLDANGTTVVEGTYEDVDNDGNRVIINTPPDAIDACVVILDLTSVHPNARGFRRGFHQFPYAYLSPGEFNIPVRCDVCDFGLHSTKILDLGTVDKRYGGYSGGFVDNLWSCFNPFRSFTGPFGGIRSQEKVDQGHLRPYFHAEVLCIHDDGWNGVGNLIDNMRSFDLGNVDVELRGFSEALRMGRFAYLSPFSSQSHVYAGKVVRIFLGAVDIGETLDYLESSGGKIRDIVDVLDLKLSNPDNCGFSGLFKNGKYVYLVPFRNKEELYNGQRGHGNVIRIDANNFYPSGVSVLSLETVTRSQIPSFADEDLRGFSGGFASGKYGVTVPFYNAVFSGKLSRFNAIVDDMDGNVQELNLIQDRDYPNVFKGFRGGFVSLWQGYFDGQ
jgi:hypothetical protein